MRRHPATTRRAALPRGRRLPLALACLLTVAAAGGASRAQGALPADGAADPPKGVTRKFDEYGKLRHCDESARLDHFAIELQNDPSLTGYLLVYMGRDDMPAWKDAILKRAHEYLVTTRGILADRLKVVAAGHREQRTTEMWVVAGADPAPEPSDTVEVEVDRTKAYQWDEKGISVEFSYDPEEGSEPQDEEDEGEAAEAEGGEAAAGAAVAEAKDGKTEEKQAEAEGDWEAEWRASVDKYEIAVEKRGLIEEEDDPVRKAAEAAATMDGAEAEADEPPVVGDVKVRLWWEVEDFAAVLKAAPDARAALVYYHGAKSADRETVRAILARAVQKLEEQFGIKGERVVTVEGGYSPQPTVELWVVPRGAEPPKPKVNKRQVVGSYSAPGAE